jgi:TolA-binding protein
MVETEKKEKVELDEVMMAMDVVDTLRHEQQLVERELASDERDQALIDKVKRMYAAQGLEVTDEVIAVGVADLKENRFAYQPPPPQGPVWLANLYVRRNRLAKWAATVAALLVGLFIIYQFAFVAPEERERQKKAKSFNTTISQQQDQLSVAKQRLINLKQALSRAEKSSTTSEVASKRLLAEAGQQLAGAETGLESLDKLPLQPDLTADRLVRDGEVIKSRLDQRRELLNGVTVQLDKAETAVSDLSEVAGIREKLASQRQSLLAESREETARSQTEKLYSDALAALNRGDLAKARQESAALQELYDHLVQEYELRIVSRPDIPSGIRRTLPNRPGVRNYYVIVEAVTPQGKRLTVPITSEENGRTYNVQQWGLRVDESLYEKIRRDKLDDGIIQDNRFGRKERSYLTPQYLMPTTGGAIPVVKE